MLAFFVGSGWAVIFGLLALLVLGLGWSFSRPAYEGERYKRLPLLATLLVTIVTLGMSYWAQTHFRVGVNERALVKDTIHQRLLGVKGSGVQARPLIGVEITIWPATYREAISAPLETGMASAPAKQTNTPLKLNPTFYLDLSGMELMEAYRDGYTSYKDLLERYILVQAGNVARSVTQLFTVEEHSTRKDEWTRLFEEGLAGFFGRPGEGYGLRVVEGRTVLTWDFVNPEDAAAYDAANRANFLSVEKKNLLRAAEEDAQIAAQRSRVLVERAQAEVRAWSTVVRYLQDLSPEELEALSGYWNFQAQMQYLALQGDLVQAGKAGTIFPPGEAPVLTYDTK